MKAVDRHPEILKMLRVARVIVMLLCVGLAAFLVFAHFNQSAGPAKGGESSMLEWAPLGLLGLTLPVWIVMRFAFLRRARDAYAHGDVPGFCQRYQTTVITLAALIEGPGFFGGVVYMLSGSTLGLSVGAACLFFLVLMIPNEGRINTLLEDAP